MIVVLDQNAIAAFDVTNSLARAFVERSVRQIFPSSKDASACGRENVNASPLRLQRGEPKVSSVVPIVCQRAAFEVPCGR
jgi:hypothetical protein